MFRVADFVLRSSDWEDFSGDLQSRTHGLLCIAMVTAAGQRGNVWNASRGPVFVKSNVQTKSGQFDVFYAIHVRFSAPKHSSLLAKGCRLRFSFFRKVITSKLKLHMWLNIWSASRQTNVKGRTESEQTRQCTVQRWRNLKAKKPSGKKVKAKPPRKQTTQI